MTCRLQGSLGMPCEYVREKKLDHQLTSIHIYLGNRFAIGLVYRLRIDVDVRCFEWWICGTGFERRRCGPVTLCLESRQGLPFCGFTGRVCSCENTLCDAYVLGLSVGLLAFEVIQTILAIHLRNWLGLAERLTLGDNVDILNSTV